MTNTLYQLAQVNIAKMRAPLDRPEMAGFVARLAEINALADASPGFVWRLQTEAGDATYLRPYEDDRILFNLSVWESIEQFKDYVYRSAHREMIQQRREWFEQMESMHMAMWWIGAGLIPTIEEAKQRLEHLRQHGETAHAFTFKRIFQPTDCAEISPAPLSLETCRVT
jgi:heme-degrading monooxygenase HmoA